ncbi:hypothetical protein RUM43_007100 [Polyplax serrata]|uniref:Uncharacterized protein n=1 Tax=Polyplax serrata TaxID=468196 RepID=A0AAN8PC43_POLSC
MKISRNRHGGYGEWSRTPKVRSVDKWTNGGSQNVEEVRQNIRGLEVHRDLHPALPPSAGTVSKLKSKKVDEWLFLQEFHLLKAETRFWERKGRRQRCAKELKFLAYQLL